MNQNFLKYFLSLWKSYLKLEKFQVLLLLIINYRDFDIDQLKIQ